MYDTIGFEEVHGFHENPCPFPGFVPIWTAMGPDGPGHGTELPMNLCGITSGRIVGLLAIASTALGLPLSLQERPVRYPFETLDQGLYSGFGKHCSAGFTSENALAGSRTDRGVRTKIVLSRTPSGPCHAAVATPAFEAIFRNECAWLDFWTEHTFDEAQDPLLFVDFSRYVVVAVIKGPGGGCSGIEIEGISRGAGDVRRIHVRQEIPCSRIDCTVLSNAYHFVLVPVESLPQDAPVAFVHDEPVPDGILMKARRPGMAPR